MIPSPAARRPPQACIYPSWRSHGGSPGTPLGIPQVVPQGTPGPFVVGGEAADAAPHAITLTCEEACSVSDCMRPTPEKILESIPHTPLGRGARWSRWCMRAQGAGDFFEEKNDLCESAKRPQTL